MDKVGLVMEELEAVGNLHRGAGLTSGTGYRQQARCVLQAHSYSASLLLFDLRHGGPGLFTPATVRL